MDIEDYAKQDVDRLVDPTKRPFSKIEMFDNGVFDLEIVGDGGGMRPGVLIDHAVFNGYGGVIYLVGKDGDNWNWDNIIRAKRVSSG